MAFNADTIAQSDTPLVFVNSINEAYTLADGGDVAILAVTLKAGVAISVHLDEENAGDESGPYQGYLRIFDALGNEVAAAVDRKVPAGAEPAFIEPETRFIPTYSGTYYFAVSNASLIDYDPTTISGRTPSFEVTPENASLGTLHLTRLPREGSFQNTGTVAAAQAFEDRAFLTLLSRDDPADGGERRYLSLQEPAFISPGNEVNVMRIDLAADDVLVVDLNGDIVTGILLDTVLRLAKANGVVVAEDDDGGGNFDSELVYSGTAGPYFIGVSGFGNDAYNFLTGDGRVVGDTGAYNVVLHLNPDRIGRSDDIADRLVAGDDGAYVIGLSGADTLIGGDGFDTLAGGDGNDSAEGGGGEDVLYGEQGDDILSGGGDGDVLVGGRGNDRLRGGGGRVGDLLQGDAGADTLIGGGGDDTLTGGADNDRLMGGTGNDALDGGDGADTLVGGGGDDTLIAGAGTDRLIGGEGADVFVLGPLPGLGVVGVADFATGTDLFDLRGIFGAEEVNADNLHLFVATVAITDASQLLVDANGATDGANFVLLAKVNGVAADALLDSDNFLL